jgi:hypothetical protein
MVGSVLTFGVKKHGPALMNSLSGQQANMKDHPWLQVDQASSKLSQTKMHQELVVFCCTQGENMATPSITQNEGECMTQEHLGTQYTDEKGCCCE